MTEKNINSEPMLNCPRFSRCSVSICPLDHQQNLRTYLKEEPKCRLAKSIRIKMGKNLPWKGLTSKEFVARKIWEEKSAEEKKKFITGGEKSRFVPVFQKRKEKDDSR